MMDLKKQKTKNRYLHSLLQSSFSLDPLNYELLRAKSALVILTSFTILRNTGLNKI